MAKKTIKISMMRVMEFHSENGEIYCTSTSKCRGSGTGGAGGAIAPPIFVSLKMIQPYSTTNIFGWLNIC